MAAEGPEGTSLISESRLWHATGPNTTSEERPVILMFFMRSFVRQQENNFLSIRPEVEANLCDKVRKRLGYMTDGAIGKMSFGMIRSEASADYTQRIQVVWRAKSEKAILSTD